MVKPIQIPPLPQTWDRYDESISRLTNGLLLPEPNYVFCCMGTNDSSSLKPDIYARDACSTIDIAPEYIRWLIAVRKACPNSAIFCIIPPTGLHAAEISAAVEAQRKAGDLNVYLIDTEPLKEKFMHIVFERESRIFSLEKGATQLAVDGVHPSVYGNAMIGALVAADVSSILHPGNEHRNATDNL